MRNKERSVLKVRVDLLEQHFGLVLDVGVGVDAQLVEQDAQVVDDLGKHEDAYLARNLAGSSLRSHQLGPVFVVQFL